MTKYILDASSLLALIKNEPGAHIVEELLGHIIMSNINVSEVAAILMHSTMTFEDTQDCILPFISSLIPFDEPQAFQTAALKKN